VGLSAAENDGSVTGLAPSPGGNLSRIISSPLMTSDYARTLPDYQAHVDRLSGPGSGH
jgi:hypothetical protein